VDDSEFRQAFEEGRLDSFHHRDHVRLAWVFLREDPGPLALERFSASLRRFATAAGKPGLYHETITWAFLLLIRERMARGPAATWEEFADQNSDLLVWRPSILDRYYEAETLASELARHTFVLPDRVRI
jgi:hypothetical protein